MASSIINNDVVHGETFLPGQIFVFGGFALRANSLGHLEQIDSYAPGHQISFGNLDYVTDIRGDLIFDGFEPMPGAPDIHDEHGLDLLSDNALIMMIITLIYTYNSQALPNKTPQLKHPNQNALGVNE